MYHILFGITSLAKSITKVNLARMNSATALLELLHEIKVSLQSI